MVNNWQHCRQHVQLGGKPAARTGGARRRPTGHPSRPVFASGAPLCPGCDLGGLGSGCCSSPPPTWDVSTSCPAYLARLIPQRFPALAGRYAPSSAPKRGRPHHLHPHIHPTRESVHHDTAHRAVHGSRTQMLRIELKLEGKSETRGASVALCVCGGYRGDGYERVASLASSVASSLFAGPPAAGAAGRGRRPSPTVEEATGRWWWRAG
eukprot:COSAG03_NODE_456_length_7759_cov_122.878068_9_plen_209_part_00